LSRRKRKSKGSGNIKAETAYDPFPKSGLVKQYEPFIRKHVGEFCKRYPGLQRDGVLLEAIRIACNTEKRFKPELGHDFSTPLRHALKGLNRYAKKGNRTRLRTVAARREAQQQGIR
jgi:DNA-directed RNA polymerase specialized sigma subunit